MPDDAIDPERPGGDREDAAPTAGQPADEPDGIEQELARLAEVLDPATHVPLPEEGPEPPQLPLDEAGPEEARTPAADALEDAPDDAETSAPTSPSTATSPLSRESRSAAQGWRTLARGLRPRATKGQLLAGVLCAVLGFALVVQVRQTASVSLSSMRQEDLLRILDESTTRGDDLAREVSALERERDQLLSDDDTRQAARDAARRTAIAQGILTGRLPAQGPGVTATILDPDGSVKPVTLLNFMEELRNAGAEAIELNGLRITASSAFTGSAGSVVLDGATITPPYHWKAIGDPDTIAPALEMPGGAVATVRGNGGSASVDQQDLVTIDSLRTAPDPAYATPVPPEAG
ncbi:DUF881 domain-containing protein [Cellulomonas soli]